MKKILSLLLKIFLIVLNIFLVLCCIPVPVLILPLICIWAQIWCLWIITKKTKILSENAKVISKTQEHQAFSTKYYVTFEFIDGTRKTMPSPVEVYGCVFEGESGVVSYKQYRNYVYLVDFQKDNDC